MLIEKLLDIKPEQLSERAASLHVFIRIPRQMLPAYFFISPMIVVPAGQEIEIILGVKVKTLWVLYKAELENIFFKSTPNFKFCLKIQLNIFQKLLLVYLKTF